jgi:hypothetical protein
MIAVILIAVFIVVVFFARGGKITVKRVTEDDPSRSGFGRACSWCSGTVEPSNHNRSCPIRGDDE